MAETWSARAVLALLREAKLAFLFTLLLIWMPSLVEPLPQHRFAHARGAWYARQVTCKDDRHTPAFLSRLRGGEGVILSPAHSSDGGISFL
jgi:hypothetical protein